MDLTDQVTDETAVFTMAPMPNPSQYGNTLFLRSLEPEGASSAEALKRIQFRKSPTAGDSHDEKWLQSLIMRHPGLLPIDQIEPAFIPLIPVCVELPVGGGYLDNLLVTPHGDLVLIECKLWRNPEARREVVGQILSYASAMATWSYQHLQDAINQTKPLDPIQKKSRDLYELVAARGEIDESSFVDAVSRNLRRGRFLLLIVGDGIREGVETLAEFLHRYAGIRFTLALVELALYKMPEHGYVAQPRVLAKTETLETRIVTFSDAPLSGASTKVQLPSVEASPKRTTISEELYFERLDHHLPGVSANLKAFLESVELLNVKRDFGTDALILRWYPANGKSWNLGAVSSRGELWLDWMADRANSAGLLEQQRAYTRKLADVAGGVMKLTKSAGAYITRSRESTSAITVDALVADQRRREEWVRAIQEFQKAVAERGSEE